MSQNIVNGLKKTKVDNTNINKIINQHPRLVRIKKKAKLLKKEEQYKDTPLSSLLDIASKELGFKHWHEAYTNIKNRYFPKSYKLEELYSFGLSKPKNMEEGIHLGYSSELNMNLWNSHKTLLNHTTIFGENEERKKLHSYLLKQSLKNNYSLTLIDNTSLINDLEEYIMEEKIEREIVKLKFINKEEYLNSPYKDKIEKTTASLLNGYIEYHFKTIFEENKFEKYTENEIKQIKLLSNIVFSYFNSHKFSQGESLKQYSCCGYYESIKKYLDWEYLIYQYPKEPIIHQYVNDNGFKGTIPCHWILDYLNTLEDFNLHNIKENSINNHNKIKDILIEFIDYLENNLYCYFENDNIIDVNRHQFTSPYIYNISISDSLIQYDNPIISHLIVTMLYENANMINLFRGINTEVLKKNAEPLPNKSIVFIKDCPLTEIISRFLSVSTINNSSIIFSYENDEKLMDSYQAAGCVNQYINCHSKQSIIEENPEPEKIKNLYHDENLYIIYQNYDYQDEKNEPIAHYLILSLKQFTEKKLLKMKTK